MSSPPVKPLNLANEYTQTPSPPIIMQISPPPNPNTEPSRVYISPYRLETKHIYHSPLKPMSLSTNSLPLRYTSPPRVSDSENLHYYAFKPSIIDAETFKTVRAENEKLRILLKDKHEELLSFVAKCSHLEKHIKDPSLLIRFEETELKLQAIINENKRLHEDLQHKSQEIDSWRSAFQRIDASMSEKISEFEAVNSELREELQQWKLKHAEIERTLTLKDQMFAQFLEESKQERQEKAKMARKDENIKETLSPAQCNELIEKIDVLIKENEKLNALLGQKLEENEKIKQFAAQQSEELDSWKSKYQELAVSYEELLRKSEDYDDNLARLTAEIESLNGLLRSKLSLIEEWKAKHLKIGQLSEKVLELQDKIYYLTEDNVKLNSTNKAKSQENEKLKENLKKIELQVIEERNNQSLKIEYEKQIEKLNSFVQKQKISIESLEFFKVENAKLNKTIEELNKETSHLRTHYVENHHLLQKNLDLNGVLVVLIAEIDGLRERIIEKDQELQQLKSKFYE